MKKLLVAVLAVLVAASFAGCKGDKNGDDTSDSSSIETVDGVSGENSAVVGVVQENVDFNDFELNDEQATLVPGDSKVDFVDHEIITASTSTPEHQRVIDYYLALAEEMNVRGKVITEESENPDIEYWVYEGVYGDDDTFFAVYIATNSEATTATVNY